MLTPTSLRHKSDEQTNHSEHARRFAALRVRVVGISEFMEFVFALVTALHRIRDYEQQYAAMQPDTRLLALTGEADGIIAALDYAEQKLRDFELDAALDRMDRIRTNIKVDCSLRTLNNELRILSQVAEDQLVRRHAVYVPLKKYDFYFEEATVFPEQVRLAFPSIKRDAISACACYALDLNTRSGLGCLNSFPRFISGFQVG